MNTTVVLLLLAALAATHARPHSQYTDRYDNVNVQDILKNKRLLVPYIKCALEQGKCSPEGRELKSHIREALETYCAKCTGPQRASTRLVISHLINHEPQYWGQLAAKYDPARKYVLRYESELKAVRVEG